MQIRPGLALTFDDVLLVPQYSEVESRRKLLTQAQLTPNLKLQIPIVSANMDTVTESEMAIAMAREGGIGIIHRFMPVPQQAQQIRRVKKFESYVVENPISLAPTATLAQARQVIEESGAGGILIVEADKRLIGIVTTRDLLFEGEDGRLLRDLMHGQVITAPPETTVDEARALLHNHRIEKLPLVDAKGRVVGLITLKDILKSQEYPRATRDARGRLAVGAAVGVRERELQRVECLLEEGTDCLVVDIAHGDSAMEVEMIRQIKRRFPQAQVIGGNVATAEGTQRLIDAGADAVKVGVGPGSICVTRVVAGAGVPQLTAIIECAAVARPQGIPVIADGGIRQPGDAAKALAAGGSTVMVGSLLAGTDESPGLMMTRKGHRYKVSRGMASVEANVERKKREGEQWITQEEIDDYVSEGVEAAVPYRGRAKEVLTQLVGGIQSGMSYSGANTLDELYARAVFVQMTASGLRESHPHDVEVL